MLAHNAKEKYTLSVDALCLWWSRLIPNNKLGFSQWINASGCTKTGHTCPAIVPRLAAHLTLALVQSLPISFWGVHLCGVRWCKNMVGVEERGIDGLERNSHLDSHSVGI